MLFFFKFKCCSFSTKKIKRVKTKSKKSYSVKKSNCLMGKKSKVY